MPKYAQTADSISTSGKSVDQAYQVASEALALARALQTAFDVLESQPNYIVCRGVMQAQFTGTFYSSMEWITQTGFSSTITQVGTGAIGVTLTVDDPTDVYLICVATENRHVGEQSLGAWPPVSASRTIAITDDAGLQSDPDSASYVIVVFGLRMPTP